MPLQWRQFIESVLASPLGQRASPEVRAELEGLFEPMCAVNDALEALVGSDSNPQCERLLRSVMAIALEETPTPHFGALVFRREGEPVELVTDFRGYQQVADAESPRGFRWERWSTRAHPDGRLSNLELLRVQSEEASRACLEAFGIRYPGTGRLTSRIGGALAAPLFAADPGSLPDFAQWWETRLPEPVPFPSPGFDHYLQSLRSFADSLERTAESIAPDCLAMPDGSCWRHPPLTNCLCMIEPAPDAAESNLRSDLVETTVEPAQHDARS